MAFEHARDAYLHAVALAPELAGAWGNLGNVYKYLGEFSTAIDCYRKEIELEPDPLRRSRRHSNLLLSLHYDSGSPPKRCSMPIAIGLTFMPALTIPPQHRPRRH